MNKETTAKDFLGNELKVGDKVASINPYYRDLILCEVLKITPCKVKLKHTYKSGHSREFYQFKAQVVKIKQPDTIEITEERYDELLEQEQWVCALEGAGVDNWDGISEAHQMVEEWNNNE